MPIRYPIEVRGRAQALYVRGITFEDVGAETGIAPSTLKKWAEEGDWTKARKEFVRRYEARQSNVMQLELDTIDIALNELGKTSQDVFARAKILEYVESALEKHERRIERQDASTTLHKLLDFAQAEHPRMYPEVGAVVTAFAAKHKEWAQLKGQHLKALRDKVAQVNATIGTPGKKQGLDTETLKQIREEIYGIVDHAGH